MKIWHIYSWTVRGLLGLITLFLQPDDKTAQAFWSMNRAGDWDAFRKALRDYVAPQMNMVYADTGGTIGFIAPARVPIRKSGYGWLPEPGWTGQYEWIGCIPFDQLAQAVNPPNGHFISANNKIVPDSYPYYITFDGALPYRADRIAALLGKQKVQKLQSTRAIAADTVSLVSEDPFAPHYGDLTHRLEEFRLDDHRPHQGGRDIDLAAGTIKVRSPRRRGHQDGINP